MSLLQVNDVYSDWQNSFGRGISKLWQLLICNFNISNPLPIDCRITDNNVKLLLSEINTQNCPNLQTLLLSNNAMAGRGCTVLANSLSSGNLKEIQHIDLQRLLHWFSGI